MSAAPARYQAFIGGEFTDAASGAVFDSEDPFSGDVWAQIPRCGVADVNRAVDAAYDAFTRGAWPAMTASARGQLLYKLRDFGPTLVIAGGADPLCRTMVPLFRWACRQDRRQRHSDR